VVIQGKLFNFYGTWNALRDKQGCVDWWQVIWFPLIIPKHAFILWLAMKNALTTGDKLLRWGYHEDTKCMFLPACYRRRGSLVL
jgi:hypothetical protein